ncbi:hypothetical protein M569_10608, partial [Genlisea aurea]
MGKAMVDALAAASALVAGVSASVMVWRSWRRMRGWGRVMRILEELEEGFATPVERLRQIVDAMAIEMHAGLVSEGGSKLKMLVTYVHDLPTGDEKGIFYALDLGGTNFRVVRVVLDSRRSAISGHDVHRQPIPQNLMSSTSEELFDFIALSLKSFVERVENVSDPSQLERRDLGFTFSFPVKQTSSSSGNLIRWTKGFSVSDMVGKNVSEVLQQAINRKGLNMRVAVLVNDTVGTLALSNYHDEDTVAAVIFGTGTNACYLEQTEAVIKCQSLRKNSGRTAVNIEWGNFWSSHLPRTSYDAGLDSDTPNPNEQCFEKMISGMYLGDIVRRVILKMSQESDFFGHSSSKLHVPFILRTPLMAAMHGDDSPDLTAVAAILDDVFEIPDAPPHVRKLVVKVCDSVTRRAARLAAAGVVGILKKVGRDGSSSSSSLGNSSCRRRRAEGDGGRRRTVVAVEGGLYKNYGGFRECLTETIDEILGENYSRRVVIKQMEDGSGIGAALLAAAAAAST